MPETFPYIIDLGKTASYKIKEVGKKTLITNFESGTEQRRSKGVSRLLYTKIFEQEESDGADVWDFYQARSCAYESFTLQIKNRSGVTVNKTVRFLRDDMSQEVVYGVMRTTGIEFIDVIQ
jgi:hypothetical protein